MRFIIIASVIMIDNTNTPYIMRGGGGGSFTLNTSFNAPMKSSMVGYGPAFAILGINTSTIFSIGGGDSPFRSVLIHVLLFRHFYDSAYSTDVDSSTEIAFW